MNRKVRPTCAILLLPLVVSLEAWAPVVAQVEDAPRISNMRFEGLKIQENMYVPSSEYDRDYKILVDFESKVPIAKVFLQTRWVDGRVSRVLERSFEVMAPGGLKGTLVIPSRILRNPMSRDTAWWVQDADGRASNKLTQRVVIRD